MSGPFATILGNLFNFAKLIVPYLTNIGASVVHEESNVVVFGAKDIDEYNMIEYCCESNYNIVIPKIGHDVNDILEFTETLKKEWEYDVHITLVSLDRKKATIRAYNRFKKSKRDVPLSLIFDWYSGTRI